MVANYHRIQDDVFLTYGSQNKETPCDSLKEKSILTPEKADKNGSGSIQRNEQTTDILKPDTSVAKQSLAELRIKNNFAKRVLGYFLTTVDSGIEKAGSQSILYFEPHKGKRIATIRFIRLHPFGSQISDTLKVAGNWIEKAGNHLHMNTSKNKLQMQLQFKPGELVNPWLMAENEKLIRDLNYIEDVSFLLQTNKTNHDEVDVLIITKDKFEYGFSASISKDDSDLEFVNENMFGMGHRLSVGMAQKNAYLPEMGLYGSYQINNIFGKFINSSIGYSNTYLKKAWNITAEKRFLTSKEVNAGGFSLDNVFKYNYIAEDHPVKLDTTVSFLSGDIWFAHAFGGKNNKTNKTLISVRYFHQEFNRKPDSSYGQSEFLRNHDFLLASLSFSRRNLYKNNLVYGYGVTEDIPFGHYFELITGLDKSQFGTWHYMSCSLNNAYINKKGGYYSFRLAIDGFRDQGKIKQGSALISSNFFSRKLFIKGQPFREFLKIELLAGINRFREEFLTIDDRFGIRDFYTNKLTGNCRLKVGFETVRYTNWNFYGFKLTNYFFTDLAFLSDQLKTILNNQPYAGIGAGFRIFNESLVFKTIDIRLTWFPVIPPEGLNPFRANLQGLSKTVFDDFTGRKPELIRFQ
jgi:hypothetical protein